MCQSCAPQINTTEEFGEKLVSILNHGSLALMLSIGHRTGLLDAMSRLDAPATSVGIAKAANLNERYVREWLGAMATGGIVTVEGMNGGTRYHLPRQHAALLTRDAGADNFATVMQYMSVLGGVEDEIVECFKKGGGVPYTSYKRFHDVMAEESGQTAGFGLFDHVLPLVPGLLDALTSGIDVADLGCGRGRTLIMMARAYPNSTFTGYDLSQDAVAAARALAAEFGLKNIQFVQRDLTTWDDDAPAEAFDLVTTFDAVHDQARPDRMLRGIQRSLKPDGTYLMQDIKASSEVANNAGNPLAPFIYTISCMHCMTVSLAQGGMGLGAAWGKELAVKMLRDAGFKSVSIKTLNHDIVNYYYIVTK